jgi:crossover junction endodeoxyribonuclease RusA
MTTIIHISAFPPSLNNLFANVAGKGRVRADRYRKWANAAGWDLKLNKPQPVKGPVSVTMLFGRPDKRRRDLDGLAKAPADLLVEHGVIEDDSLIQRLTLAWAPITGMQITVEAA